MGHDSSDYRANYASPINPVELYLWNKPVKYTESEMYQVGNYWDFLSDAGVDTSEIKSWIPKPHIGIYSGDLHLNAGIGNKKLISRGMDYSIADTSNDPWNEAIVNLLDSGGGETILAKASMFPYVSIVAQRHSFRTDSNIGFYEDTDDDTPRSFYKNASASGVIWSGNDTGCWESGQEYRGSASFTYNEEDDEWESTDSNIESRTIHRSGSNDSNIEDCGDKPENGEWGQNGIRFSYSRYAYNSVLAEVPDDLSSVISLSVPFENADYRRSAFAKGMKVASDPEKVLDLEEAPSYYPVYFLGKLHGQRPFFLQGEGGGGFVDYSRGEGLNTLPYSTTHTFHDDTYNFHVDQMENKPRPNGRADTDFFNYMRFVPVFLGMSGTFRVRLFAFKRTAEYDYSSGIHRTNDAEYGEWEIVTLMDQTHTVVFDQMHVGETVEFSSFPSSDIEIETGYNYFFGTTPLESGYVSGSAIRMPMMLVTKES